VLEVWNDLWELWASTRNCWKWSVNHGPCTPPLSLYLHEQTEKQDDFMGEEIMNVIGLMGEFWLGFWTERNAEICVNLGFGNERWGWPGSDVEMLSFQRIWWFSVCCCRRFIWCREGDKTVPWLMLRKRLDCRENFIKDEVVVNRSESGKRIQWLLWFFVLNEIFFPTGRECYYFFIMSCLGLDNPSFSRVFYSYLYCWGLCWNRKIENWKNNIGIFYIIFFLNMNF